MFSTYEFDIFGVNRGYSVSIADLPAGYDWWHRAGEVSRFNTAVVEFNGWDSVNYQSTRELRLIDLETGVVLAGRSMASNEFLMASRSTDTLFHIGTLEGSTLTVSAYDYGLGATQSSLMDEVGSGISFTFATSVEGYTFYEYLPPSAGLGGKAYLLASYWDGAKSASVEVLFRSNAQGLMELVPLPAGILGWTDYMVEYEGAVWLKTSNEKWGQPGFKEVYFRLDSASSDWVEVTQEDFWDAWDSAQGADTVVRDGEFVLDLITHMAGKLPDGYSLEVDHITALPDGGLLVQIDVEPAGGIDYHHWLVFKEGKVTAEKGFSSPVGYTQWIMETVGDGYVYFGVVNATAILVDGKVTGFIQQEASDAVQIYRVALRDIESALNNAGDTLVGVSGVEAIEDYSKRQLTGVADLGSEKIVVPKWCLPVSSVLGGDSKAYLISTGLYDLQMGTESHFLAWIDPDGVSPWPPIALPQQIEDVFLDSVRGLFILTDDNENIPRQAFWVDIHDGALTAIRLESFGEPNESPSGEVSITGTAIQGQTLTASNSLADADGLGSITYTWFAGGSATPLGTGTSYRLTAGEAGKTITVTASYRDGGGTQESVTSTATAPVIALAGVTRNGTTKADTLVGTEGNDTLNGNGGNDVLTGNGGADLLNGGTGTDKMDGGDESDLYIIATTAEHPAAEINDTGVSGTDEVRFTATSASTLTLYAGDVGIERVVLGTGTGPTAITTATVALNLNASAVRNGLVVIGNNGANVITGTSHDDLLEGNGGNDNLIGGSGNDALIDGSGADTLNGGDGDDLLVATDGGNILTGGAGSDTFSIRAPSATANTITDFALGDRIVFDGLQSLWSLASGNGSGLGAGLVRYTVTGTTTTLYIGLDGTAGADATVVLQNVSTPQALALDGNAIIFKANTPVSGTPSITGEAKQGQTLTANTTGLADPDGIGTLAYQWYAGGTAISGATLRTFTLTQAEVGKTITVAASYTDGLGYRETSTSAATPAVANVNDVPTGAVTISGSPTQGQTLTAANNLADLDGLGTITYTWYASGSATPLMTGATYTLTANEVGKTITVTARYTDGGNTAESVTSSATSAVTSVPSGTTYNGTAGNDTYAGGTGNDTLYGNGGNDVLNGGAGSDLLSGGTGADSLTGGAGSDRFVFTSGDSGQTTGFDRITDFAKGAVGTGDLIDFSVPLTIGGSAAKATSSAAQINASTGIATFASKSGTTLADALADIAARFTAAADSAGEFAFFKVGGTGDYYLFISDGASGVTTNDVVIQLVGVTTISSITVSGGDLTVLG